MLVIEAGVEVVLVTGRPGIDPGRLVVLLKVLLGLEVESDEVEAEEVV